jgi:hypothetical protein
MHFSVFACVCSPAKLLHRSDPQWIQAARMSRCSANSIRKRGGRPCRNLGALTDRNLSQWQKSLRTGRECTSPEATNDAAQGPMCPTPTTACFWSTFQRKWLKAVDPPQWAWSLYSWHTMSRYSTAQDSRNGNLSELCPRLIMITS